MIEATAREAARDADRVGLLLKELGFLPTPDHTLHLPTALLLALAAALRLLDWESSGLTIHREAGLPVAEQALVDAFGSPEGEDCETTRRSPSLAHKVVSLFADRFAWHGRRDLDADVVLDDHDDEDALVEALAELLWDTRHARRVPGDSGVPR